MGQTDMPNCWNRDSRNVSQSEIVLNGATSDSKSVGNRTVWWLIISTSLILASI